MGYNTTILVLNDAFDLCLDKHKDEFCSKIRSMSSSGYLLRGRDPLDPDEVGVTAESFSVGNHCNPAAVMTCTHADFTSVILVGGNYATVLGEARGYEHHKKKTVKRMLNDVLAQYGLKVIETKEKK
jgi:hypothetical protein